MRPSHCSKVYVFHENELETFSHFHKSTSILTSQERFCLLKQNWSRIHIWSSTYLFTGLLNSQYFLNQWWHLHFLTLLGWCLVHALLRTHPVDEDVTRQSGGGILQAAETVHHHGIVEGHCDFRQTPTCTGKDTLSLSDSCLRSVFCLCFVHFYKYQVECPWL